MMEPKAKEFTNIYRYSDEKRQWVLKHNYEYLLLFKFAGETFIVTHNGNMYYVCVGRNGDAYSLFKKKDAEDGMKLTAGEIASIFRKKYLKNKVTSELIDNFIESPVAFGVKNGVDQKKLTF